MRRTCCGPDVELNAGDVETNVPSSQLRVTPHNQDRQERRLRGQNNLEAGVIKDKSKFTGQRGVDQKASLKERKQQIPVGVLGWRRAPAVSLQIWNPDTSMGPQWPGLRAGMRVTRIKSGRLPIYTRRVMDSL